MFYIQNDTEPIGLWDLPKSYGWQPCLQKKQKNIVSESLSLLNYLNHAFNVYIPSHDYCSDVLHLFWRSLWRSWIYERGLGFLFRNRIIIGRFNYFRALTFRSILNFQTLCGFQTFGGKWLRLSILEWDLLTKGEGFRKCHLIEV